MIISFSKRIFFIRIPKCAGTTIRKLLTPIDEKSFENKNKQLDILNLDIDHLPLFALEEYFPDIYK